MLKIEATLNEMQRLVATLKWYAWMQENHGIVPHEDIKGVLDVTIEHRRRSARLVLNAYSFKLRDESVKVIRNIPFPKEVVCPTTGLGSGTIPNR